MSAAYLRAVRRADGLVGKLLRAIDNHPEIKDRLVVLLTADHGGAGKGHSDRTRLANYRIPFVAWGPGVVHGNLYAMNPRYADPGRRQPGLGGKQPIRNADVANLVTDLLGLRVVPGSRFNARHQLRLAR